MEVNRKAIYKVCVALADRCSKWGHNADWFFEQVMPAFDGKVPAVSVTIAVLADYDGWCHATIDRSGSYTMKRA